MGQRVSNQRYVGIAPLLEDLCQRYRPVCLEKDPVYLVHQYSDSQDQEVVGLISALLAFGNVLSIQRSVGKLLKILGPHPAQAVREGDFEPRKEIILSLKHRWVKGEDLLLLLRVLSRLLNQHGSLQQIFISGDHHVALATFAIVAMATAAERAPRDDISFRLHHFCGTFLKEAEQIQEGKRLSRGFRYFFPSPQDRSPCKRLNLFLRWMVRPSDGIDLGLWTKVSPAELVIPLDTHVFRFARRYRIGKRTSNWNLAHEVTDFLRVFDLKDPVKFDFPICHYGMEVGW